MSRERRILAVVLAAWVSSCGGGGDLPSTGNVMPTPTPALPATVSVAVVDGDGAPVADANVTLDGVVQAPQAPGSNLYVFAREPAGRTLGVDHEGFLQHLMQAPARDVDLDLFPVPRRGSKEWIRTLIYEGTVSPRATLVRLLRPVSIVRGPTVPDADWTRVRPVWEQAAQRMSDVTGYRFRVVDEAEPGSVTYSVQIDPNQTFNGFFQWMGTDNVIASGTVSFRGNAAIGRLSLILHELTHGFGLNHSDQTTDVMHPDAVSLFHSEREMLVIRSMARRPPRTAFEDDVRNTTGTSGVSSRSYSCGGS